VVGAGDILSSPTRDRGLRVVIIHLPATHWRLRKSRARPRPARGAWLRNGLSAPDPKPPRLDLGQSARWCVNRRTQKAARRWRAWRKPRARWRGSGWVGRTTGATEGRTGPAPEPRSDQRPLLRPCSRQSPTASSGGGPSPTGSPPSAWSRRRNPPTAARCAAPRRHTATPTSRTSSSGSAGRPGRGAGGPPPGSGCPGYAPGHR